MFLPVHSASILPQLEFIENEPRLTEDQGSWFGIVNNTFWYSINIFWELLRYLSVSIGFFTSIPGSLLSGYACDNYGRKKTLLLLLLLVFGSMIMVGLAKTYHMMMVGRTLHGFAYGSIVSVVGVYNSEICQPKIRNYSGAFGCSSISFCYAFCFILDTLVNWRHLVFISCGITLVNFVLLLIVVPESPTWYLLIDRTAEAKNSLLTLRGDEEAAENEYEHVYENIKKEKSNTSTESTIKLALKLFREPSFRKPFTSIIVMVILGHEFAGFGAIGPYFNMIMIKIGLPINPAMVSTTLMLSRAPAAMVGIILMKHFNRKTLYAIGGTMMVMGNFLVFVALEFDINILFGAGNTFVSWLPIVGLFMLYWGFAGCQGHVVFAMQGELLPANGRGFGSGLTVMCMALSTFTLTKVLPTFERTFGLGYMFLTFAVCTLMSVVIVAFFVPETRGKTLEEIASYYRQDQTGPEIEWEKFCHQIIFP